MPDLAFAAYLGERFFDEPDLAAALGAANPAELYLAFGCLHGQAWALAGFERDCLSHVAPHLAHLRRPAAFIDDVRQRLVEKLLVRHGDRAPRIGEYSGRGSLARWVKVAALRTALDLIDQERRHGNRADVDEADTLGQTADPELTYIKERHRDDFRAAFQAALAALTPEQRNVLRLNVLDGLNIAQIGALFGVHRATIARRIAGAREALLLGTRQQLQARLGASERDVDSLVTLLRSQLDVSLHRYLGKDAGE
jgi:RNA polymerase sigma-70 factor, ECF subfamily